MVTPFNSDLSVNYDTAQDLAEFLCGSGSDGVVVAGTTGEAPTLSFDEQIKLFEAVREVIPPNKSFVAGTGSNNTESAMFTSKAAERVGADAILAVSPYYNRPPQAGIEKYFRDVAGAVNIPVIVYDIPVRTGRGIETETMLNIMNIENVIGWKDASGDVGRAKTELIPNTIKLCWSGDDSLNSEFMRAGGYGAISVVAHWAGFRVKQSMYGTNSSRLTKWSNEILESSYTISGTDMPNPMSTKAVLREFGFDVGHCRPPLDVETPLNADKLEDIKKMMSSALVFQTAKV